jgi:ABC-type branched-subunit amino acid transport system substrate-binding protein
MHGIDTALRLAREDGWPGGRPLAVRHVDSSTGQPADSAVRLLAVNRVAALVLGPGVQAQPALVAASAQGALALVLDELPEPPAGLPAVLLGPDPGQRGEELAKLARDRSGARRIAVVSDPSDPVSAALARAFVGAWGKDGRLVEVNPDSEKVPPPAADVVLAAVPPAKLDAVCRRFAGVDGGALVLYGGPDVEEAEVLAAGHPGEVYHVTAFAASGPLSEVGQRWREAHVQTWSHPPGRAAALAADSIYLLLAGLRTAPSPGRDGLAKALDRLDTFTGVTGTVRWSNGRPHRPLYLLVSASGKVRKVQRLPQTAP